MDHDRDRPGAGERDEAEDGGLKPETAAGVGPQDFPGQPVEVGPASWRLAPIEGMAEAAWLKLAGDRRKGRRTMRAGLVARWPARRGNVGFVFHVFPFAGRPSRPREPRAGNLGRFGISSSETRGGGPLPDSGGEIEFAVELAGAGGGDFLQNAQARALRAVVPGGFAVEGEGAIFFDEQPPA